MVLTTKQQESTPNGILHIQKIKKAPYQHSNQSVRRELPVMVIMLFFKTSESRGELHKNCLFKKVRLN